MEELALLVTKAQSGDVEAYGQIVRRFQDMAYGYAHSILADFHLAEDAAQEAFVQAYRELPNLREAAAFAGWFRRIVFTQCSRITRGKHPDSVPLESLSEMASTDPGPHEAYESSEMKARVIEAIRSLPENERVATTLFYINGYSHNDIAGFLEVAVSTVKSRLHTSRRRLKESMLSLVGDYLHAEALPEDFSGRILAAIPPISSMQVNQFIAALTAVLAARDETVVYDELMGLSGAAFRVHFWMPEWCPSSVDLLGGYQHHSPVLEALGYEYELYRTSGEEWRDAAVRSLDAGRPVIMENIDGTGRYAVVVGYIDGGKQWTARKWGNPAEEHMVSTDHPWNALVIGNRAKPMEPRKALRRSLEIALELAHTEAYVRDDSPQASGFSAYEAWVNALADEDAFAKADAGTVEYFAHANEVIYTVLVDARSSAARYLRTHARDLGHEAQPYLLRAAELYSQIAAGLSAVRANVPGTMPEFQSNQLTDSAHWTQEMRASQAAAIRRACELERRAVSELGQVVALK